MKMYIFKVTIFCLIFILIVITGYIVPDKTGYQNLHYSIYDKHRLLKNTKSNSTRLILAGGSNVSFGVYSPLIEDSLRITVINTAIHAGYGLKFIIDDLKKYLKSGDIVILSFEYGLFFGNSFYGKEALIQLVDAYPEALLLFSLEQVLTNANSFIKESLFKIKAFILSPLIRKSNSASVYRRDSFNEHGDVTAHWNKKRLRIDNNNTKGKLNNKSFIYLSKFRTFAEQKHIKLYMMYPSFNKTSFDLSSEIINQVKTGLAKTNIPILGTPEQYSFQDSLYFNSSYHLTKEGQLYRTTLLINDLKNTGLFKNN
jgi:hypothetical protein